jgi:hypothetical protein
VLFELFQEFRVISKYEQLVILHVPQIMNAYSARCAFTQVGNLSASVRPPLRVKRAVMDRAYRV